MFMIPDLNALPPLPEEEHPLKKLVRPALALCFLIIAGACLIWFLTDGIKKLANEEVNVMGGLRSLASDLWTTGSAPEVKFIDPDLITELARLRRRVGLTPAIVVAAAENRAGQPIASHELIYFQGDKHVLVIRVFLDVAEGKVDVLSHRTGPEYMESGLTP